MKTVLAALIAAFAAASAAAAAAAAAPPPEPRAAVAEIAAAIAGNYFDPDKARTIAAGLNAEAEGGAYDAFTDPRDLARKLTERLKPEDAHFRVQWEGGADPATGAPTVRRDRGGEERRTNYGFQRIEILTGNVGVLQLNVFADFDTAEDPARRAADAALQSLAHVDALIIDLRQNGGGSPAMVGYLVSAFMGKDFAGYNAMHARDGIESEAPREPYAAPRPDLPLFILVSGRSGSAAEAFPYTLKAAGRAVIIGEPTRGAANPGRPFDVASGFSVFVSTASPVNPLTGGNWEGVGVTPDIAVAASAALDAGYEAALEAVLKLDLPDAEKTEARWTLEALRAPAVSFAAADYLGTFGDAVITESDKGLVLTRGRRPPVTLKPVSADLFAFADALYWRVQFDRDTHGKVEAANILSASGNATRLRRAE